MQCNVIISSATFLIFLTNAVLTINVKTWQKHHKYCARTISLYVLSIMCLYRFCIAFDRKSDPKLQPKPTKDPRLVW